MSGYVYASFAGCRPRVGVRLRPETPMTRRFVICRFCRYHMEPRLTVDGACVNAARCNGRIRRRAFDRAAVKR